MRSKFASVIYTSLHRTSHLASCRLYTTSSSVRGLASNTIPSTTTPSTTISSTTQTSCFHSSNLEKGWCPPKPARKASLVLPKKLSPTSEWTVEELHYFNLHYYQVSDWKKYFCESNTEMPKKALDLAKLDLNMEEIIQGVYYFAEGGSALLTVFRCPL